MADKKLKNNSKEQSLILSSDLGNIEKVEKFSQKICRKMGFSSEQTDNMAIALTELAVNAMVHGNKEDPKKKITFHAIFGENTLQVSIKDEGDGFNPAKLADPTNSNNILKEHGRGIFLVQNLIDEVRFDASESGMIIILTEKVKTK
jgi:serine/threonine-protein kinase RsbW